MDENKTYVLDWFENKLTNDELKQYVSEEDFLAYQKIKDALENYTLEDLQTEKSYDAIKSKISKGKETSVKVIPIWKFVSIAASLLLLVSTFLFFSQKNSFETDFGQKQSLVLLDNSKVILNTKSTIEYSNFFRFNRNLFLQGEAYFQVQKGSKFTVNTKYGTVEVLGTKFNVNSSDDDFFEVMCYEGKVRVSFNKEQFILTKGEIIRFNKNSTENWASSLENEPTWIGFETSFKNTPIKQVFEKIRNQYNVQIDFPKTIDSIKFTGTITNENLDTALQSVCIPLNLKIKKINSRKIRVYNE